MRYKKIMMLTIILTCLLAVSAVSATENATDDIVSADVSEDSVSVEKTTDQVVSVENDNQVITEGNDSDVGSFADLQTEISNVEEGGVLNLTKDYKYVNGSTEGISINKAITINGQGHTIDGNQLSRSFYINANNVVLNNINFLNSKIKSDGGAVYWVGNNGVLDNCDFINCSNLFNPNRDNYYGGAIYWNGFNATISYCNFINNTAWCTAGVYISGYSENCSISYCNFINNTALYVAAIDWVDSIYGFIDCCNFINNNAEFSGIVQTSSSEYISITSCNFEENKVTNNDGVLNDCVDNSYIFNCTFKNNLAYNGGGISSSGGTNKRIIKCIFENNQANYGGGGFYAYSLKDSIFDNCTFINNSAKNFGGAFCLYLSKNVNIQNSIFINNSVNSNVNSIYFGESTSGTVENTYFNPNFGNVIEDSELILIRGSAFLDCDDLTFDYKNNVTWELSLKNSLNLYLDNQSIKCYLNLDGSEIFSLITDDKGIARASNELSNLNAGTWNVTVIFEGDDNYAPCNATATITVLPLSSSVTVDDINASWDQETTFTSHVLSNGTPVNEGTVSFYIGDEFIGDAPVNAGVASLTHEAPDTLGEHAIKVIFNSINYLSSNKTAKLIVNSGDIDVSKYESVATFKELSGLIENTPEGGVLNLTKDYIYVSGSTEGIQINKPITIDGQGHSLDGNYASRIFAISSEMVSLKNLKIVDGINWIGGAIYSSGQNLNIINCTFENNVAKVTTGGDGGAIYISGKNSNVIKCTFVNCSAECGGAILWSAENGNLINSSFYKCFAFRNKGDAEKQGAAVRWEGNFGKIINCTFNNNFGTGSAFFCGGAIYLRNSDNVLISDCFFINNTAVDGAGIYIVYCDYANIINCSFISNNASTSPAIDCSFCNYGLIINCSFINNSFYAGGIISAVGGSSWNNGVVLNCSFINNLGEMPLWFSGSSITINNNLFEPDYNKQLIIDGDAIIIRRISNISCNNLIFSYRNSTNIFAMLKTENDVNLVNKTIIFNIQKGDYNYEIIKITDANGTVSIYNLNNLSVGTWDVTIIFEGSYTYAPCNATATITVLPPSSSVTMDDVNATVGHEVTLVANVNSSLVINNGVVTFFDGETQIGKSPVYDGVATLTYTPTTAGEHNILAKFISENYGDSNDTAILSVEKGKVDLSVDYIQTVLFSNPSNFAVNVLSNSKRVNEGNIKYYVNGNYIGMSNVYDGKSSTSYTTNTTGSFELLAIYNETDNYLARNVSTTFYVNQMPTTLTGESVIFDEQQYKTFTTELKDNNANGVYNQTVRIELIKYSGESATFTGVSDGNGITFYDVGTLAGGMWYVAGTYSGNENYIGSNFADKFIVVRLDTTTEIEEIQNAQVNHNYKLKANIHDENGKLVKEGILQFYLDGVDIGSIDLSENQGHQSALREGVLGAVNPMFEYELGVDASDLYLNYVPTKAGKHTLTAVYEGTTLYRSSNSTTTFEVANSNTKETTITANGFTTVYNGGKDLVITLKDVNGKPVSGATVTVVLGGKTYTPNTDKNGQVKVTTNGLKPVKKYTATITFKGNSKYDKSSTTAKVKVNKAYPKFKYSAATFKRTDKKKKYTIRFLTNQNTAMKYAKVYIKVNKKVYAAKTNKKGFATFKLTKLTKKGKYTANIIFKGDSYYNILTKKVKIRVK